MSLLYVHGFDNLDAIANMTYMLPGWIDTTYWASSTTQLRTGSGRSLRCAYYSKVLNIFVPMSGTLVVGFAMYCETTGVTRSLPILEFRTINDLQACALYVGPDNSINLVRGVSTSIIGSSAPGVFEQMKWNYYEVKIVFGNSTAGSCEVKKDGNTVLNLTGLDTVYDTTGVVEACHVLLGMPSGSVTRYAYIDDIYIDDANFLGDCRVDLIKANGAGTHTGFTPSTGSNYQNVDESYFDLDTTYNSTTTLNTIDSYAMENIATLGTIHAVAYGVIARKDDGGEIGIQLFNKSGTTETLSGTDIYLGDIYNEYQKIHETDPDTSAAWTVAGVNAAEFGLKVTDV